MNINKRPCRLLPFVALSERELTQDQIINALLSGRVPRAVAD